MAASSSSTKRTLADFGFGVPHPAKIIKPSDKNDGPTALEASNSSTDTNMTEPTGTKKRSIPAFKWMREFLYGDQKFEKATKNLR